MRKTGVLFLALFCATGPSSARTEETIHSDINIKIRDAGMYGSEIMRTMHFLTDVHGPRRQQPEPGPGRLSANQITMRIDEFLKTNGARIIEEDAKKSAIAIASAVYHLAMREEMPPRFSKETMPPPPARTTESQQP